MCSEGFFGYGAAPPHGTSNMTNNETVYHLRCSECPDGARCNALGVTFDSLELEPHRWQNRDLFQGDRNPGELSAMGVEDCIRVDGADPPVCPGGANWSACRFGHHGYACSRCIVGDGPRPQRRATASGATATA